MTLMRKLKPENEQGENEEVIYRFSSTPWGSNPSDVTVRVLDVSADYADVSAVVIEQGDPQVNADLITLPKIRNLKRGHVYRLLPRFTTGGKRLEPIFVIFATR